MWCVLSKLAFFKFIMLIKMKNKKELQLAFSKAFCPTLLQHLQLHQHLPFSWTIPEVSSSWVFFPRWDQPGLCITSSLCQTSSRKSKSPSCSTQSWMSTSETKTCRLKQHMRAACAPREGTVCLNSGSHPVPVPFYYRAQHKVFHAFLLKASRSYWYFIILCIKKKKEKVTAINSRGYLSIIGDGGEMKYILLQLFNLDRENVNKLQPVQLFERGDCFLGVI